MRLYLFVTLTSFIERFNPNATAQHDEVNSGILLAASASEALRRAATITGGADRIRVTEVPSLITEGAWQARILIEEVPNA